MTIDKGNFEWKQEQENENGYYFVLTDTCHHADYNVVLFKDDGRITVNGAYINNIPRDISCEIIPRLNFFKAQHRIKHSKQYKHTAQKTTKKAAKKN